MRQRIFCALLEHCIACAVPHDNELRDGVGEDEHGEDDRDQTARKSLKLDLPIWQSKLKVVPAGISQEDVLATTAVLLLGTLRERAGHFF